MSEECLVLVSGEVRVCLDEAVEPVTWGLGGLRRKSILHLRKLVLWPYLYHKAVTLAACGEQVRGEQASGTKTH